MDTEGLLQHMLKDKERLARFAAENPHLVNLLNQSWRGFIETTRAETSPPTAPPAPLPATTAAEPPSMTTDPVAGSQPKVDTPEDAVTAVAVSANQLPDNTTAAVDTAATDSLSGSLCPHATPSDPPEDAVTAVTVSASQLPDDTAAAADAAATDSLSGSPCPHATPSDPPANEAGTAATAAPSPSGDNTDMARLPQKPQATPIQHQIRLPHLPNASVGQPYDAPFAAPVIVAVHCPPDSGLTWEQGRLHGTPCRAGENILHIEVQMEGQRLYKTLALQVNPDPKSLWQDKPSDKQDPFYKPDQDGAVLDTPAGRLIAARVRGRSHAHIGSFCDDDYSLGYHKASGTHILAVSDGAGSAAFSRLGSQLAVNTAADTVLTLLDNAEQHGKLPEIDAEQLQNMLENLFHHAIYQVLQAHAQAVDRHDAIADSKALSCTFLLALSLPRADGSWLTAAYWVGDGAIACDDGNGFQLLGHADSGTYSGETQFLSHQARTPEALAGRTRLLSSPCPPKLMLLSDGVSDPKFETDANLAKPELWQALWQELQTPLADEAPELALQDWLGFWSPGNHDDRTLALFIPSNTATDDSTDSSAAAVSE